MTHNTTRHTGPTLPTLSPEALDALKLPLTVNGDEILSNDGSTLVDIRWCVIAPANVRGELAAFIAAALNALLTPAAPAPEPVSDAEWLERR